MRHTKNTMGYKVTFRFSDMGDRDKIVGFLKASGMEVEYYEESYSVHAVIPSLGHEDPQFKGYSSEYDEFSYMTPEMVENALLLYPGKSFWCRGIYHGFIHDGLVERHMPHEKLEEPLY